uniref:NADH dehydrogenase subunit 2 n=1 Tax=Dardanus arrosor TaxID=1070701 RepID=UPI001EDE45E9|nr:NADH dehydrogenase subunit 2 [Dardanus arrosor]UIR97901.1 NADH dehydrogenase subunit 2 [Dardanus arrosor]
MYFSVFKLFFMMTLLVGTILSVSSSSWFGAWVGLELNLLSFIPIMINMNDQYSSEAALKYFLIQALGSSLVMTAVILMMLHTKQVYSLLVCALVLKLGAAPFHFWFPEVVSELSWPQAAILMTIQKIAPLYLLCYLASEVFISEYLYIFAMFSAILGALGGLNQTSLRKIMAFSSINHMGWLFASVLISESMMIIYFLFYCLISLSVVFIFHYSQMYHFKHLMTSVTPTSMKVLMFMSLLSLGGLPPFTGFFPKWMIIQEMAGIGSMVPLFVLLGASLITLYFYLRVATIFFTLSKNNLMILFKTSKYYNLLVCFLVFINFFGLLTPSLMMII